MTPHSQITSAELAKRLKRGELLLGGNSKLKIYGLLSCASGKRMKVSNRVFFVNEAEAIRHGYRPCGHCMRNQYQSWKLKRSTKITA